MGLKETVMLQVQEPKVTLQSLQIDTRKTGVVELGLDTPWDSRAHVEQHALATFKIDVGERRSFELELDVVLDEGGQAAADRRVRQEFLHFTRSLHQEALELAQPDGRAGLLKVVG